MSAAEDTVQGIYNFALGHLVVIGPQGGGRVRMYLCYHDRTQARFQGSGDLARFVEGCKKTGASAALFEDARQAGPLATFGCAHSWVDHPYRDGVALIGDTATSSDPTWGQGLSLTLRDARVLRDHLQMTGTKYGCGMALCGACTVHVDGTPTRSCSITVDAVAGKAITAHEPCRLSRKTRAGSQTRFS